jgi:CRISPR/Cas system endoribonuclease Cas6 (RAMP superfamily)
VQIALPIPEELLEELEERLRALVREELARAGKVTPWLDVNGVVEYAVLSEDAVRSATKRGQLRSYRSTTGRVRYRVEDVDAFLRGESN